MATQPLTVAVALLAAACTTPPVDIMSTGRIVLSVTTWNMDAGRGDLPRFIVDLETGRLTPGRPDNAVLLLQEAVAERSAELNELARARKWQLVFEPVGFDGRRTRGNAIISSRPLVNPRATTLPRERQPRGAVTASIEVAGERCSWYPRTWKIA